MQKVRRYQSFLFLISEKEQTRLTSTVCSCQVSVSISIPSWGSISPFPHGTCSLSVKTAFLGLEGGPPIFRQNECSALLFSFLCFYHMERLRGYHPLWPPFPRGSTFLIFVSVFFSRIWFFTLFFHLVFHFVKNAKNTKTKTKKSRNKTTKSKSAKKGPFPLSLTTTYGISVDFFSFSYVDVSVH